MKLNIDCDTNIMNGYLNVTSNGLVGQSDLPDNTKVAVGHASNLDPIIGDGQVTEIFYNRLFSTIQPNTTMNLLAHWHKKLAPNGVLKIFMNDIRSACLRISTGELTLQEAHNVIFGENYENKSILDIAIIKELLEKAGYVIQSISSDGYYVSIEAKRK